MTDEEIEKINNAYFEFCKHDGKKLYHLPFVIWLKQVAKINPDDYYEEERDIKMIERTELEIKHMTKEENYICGYNDAIADIHEQYMLIPITDNMTNGDMILKVFPDAKGMKSHDSKFITYTLGGFVFTSVDIGWWNAPYKESN